MLPQCLRFLPLSPRFLLRLDPILDPSAQKQELAPEFPRKNEKLGSVEEARGRMEQDRREAEVKKSILGRLKARLGSARLSLAKAQSSPKVPQAKSNACRSWL